MIIYDRYVLLYSLNVTSVLLNRTITNSLSQQKQELLFSFFLFKICLLSVVYNADIKTKTLYSVSISCPPRHGAFFIRNTFTFKSDQYKRECQLLLLLRKSHKTTERMLASKIGMGKIKNKLNDIT